MEVLNLLASNKVTQSINSNNFEESRIKPMCPLFKSMLDPASILSRPKQELAKPKLDNMESLYYIFARHLDSTIDLFKGVDLQAKVKQFRDGIIKAFEIKAKELGLSRSKITADTLAHNVHHALMYMSKLLDINICFETSLFKGMKESDVVIHIIKGDTGFKLEDNINTKECYKKITLGIEAKLVKDVREIATMMGISLSDNDKKLRSKKALLDLIYEKVA